MGSFAGAMDVAWEPHPSPTETLAEDLNRLPLSYRQGFDQTREKSSVTRETSSRVKTAARAPADPPITEQVLRSCSYSVPNIKEEQKLPKFSKDKEEKCEFCGQIPTRVTRLERFHAFEAWKDFCHSPGRAFKQDWYNYERALPINTEDLPVCRFIVGKPICKFCRFALPRSPLATASAGSLAGDSEPALSSAGVWTLAGDCLPAGVWSLAEGGVPASSPGRGWFSAGHGLPASSREAWFSAGHGLASSSREAWLSAGHGLPASSPSASPLASSALSSSGGWSLAGDCLPSSSPGATTPARQELIQQQLKPKLGRHPHLDFYALWWPHMTGYSEWRRSTGRQYQKSWVVPHE